MAYPQLWNVRAQVTPDGKPKWLCKTHNHGLNMIGIDIKSHQTQEVLVPNIALVQGNDAQDTACDRARSLPLPEDVKLPTSPTFAYITFEGSMFTSPINISIRRILREQASKLFRARKVQGKSARMEKSICSEAIKIHNYTNCNISERARSLILSTDTCFPLDLSRILFRMLRAIAGGWTEILHVDTSIKIIATKWAADNNIHIRTCPLCKNAQGTPRHTIMDCSALQPQREHFWDVMDAEILRLSSIEAMTEAADKHWDGKPHPPSFTIAYRTRWPALCAWGWLVSSAELEQRITEGTWDSSSGHVDKETSTDLAYRGVMPRDLGYAIQSQNTVERDTAQMARDEEAVDTEHFATTANPDQTNAELAASATHTVKFARQIEVTTTLVLGLRYLRSEYHTQIQAWGNLMRLSAEAAGIEEHGQIATSPTGDNRSINSARFALKDRFQEWHSSRTGSQATREMRWSIPKVHTINARMQTELRQFNRFAENPIIKELQAYGVPIRFVYGICWGTSRTSWKEAKDSFQHRCTCNMHTAGEDHKCLACRGFINTPRNDQASYGICPWCNIDADVMCAVCNIGIHYMGQCILPSRGAHTDYKPSPGAHPPVCPDCIWLPIKGDTSYNCDRASRHCPAVVAIQMDELASACRLGAGSGAPQYPSRTRVKRLINRYRRRNMHFEDISRDVIRIVANSATASHVQDMISDIWSRSSFRSVISNGGPPHRRQRLR